MIKLIFKNLIFFIQFMILRNNLMGQEIFIML